MVLFLTRNLRAAATQLEDVLGLEEGSVIQVLETGLRKHYKVYKKKKKNSEKFRDIRAPFDDLKEIQWAIKDVLLDDLEVSSISHGYVAGRGIDSNVSPHTCSRSMVEFDLENAYDSVSLHDFLGKTQNFTFVESLLSKIDLDPALAALVLELVDYYHNNRWLLPQGTPTSPQLFNLVCRPMDERLIRFAANTGAIVTRYADNIFFSWPDCQIPPKVIRAIKRIITDSGFVINEQKTKIQNNGNRLGVPLRFPGINLVEGKVFIPRETLRRLRARIFNAGKEYAEEILLPILFREIERDLLEQERDQVEIEVLSRDLEDERKKDPRAVRAGIKGYAIQACGKMPHQWELEFQHGRAHITGEDRI